MVGENIGLDLSEVLEILTKTLRVRITFAACANFVPGFGKTDKAVGCHLFIDLFLFLNSQPDDNTRRMDGW